MIDIWASKSLAPTVEPKPPLLKIGIKGQKLLLLKIRIVGPEPPLLNIKIVGPKLPSEEEFWDQNYMYLY
jgi:hypothetical protein